MTMPGSAPLIPASNDPVVETVDPPTALVCSPKYQTSPWESWAYQSKVSSLGSPSMLTLSWTTRVVTPMTVLVSPATSTMLRSWPSRLVPS
jgi:hypothetical protein